MGRLKMTSLKFPSFSDASIANFEQVFVSWCFTISFTLIKKKICKKYSLIRNNIFSIAHYGSKALYTRFFYKHFMILSRTRVA